MFTKKFFEKHKLTPADLKAKFSKVQSYIDAPAGDSESQQLRISGVDVTVQKPVSKYDQQIVDLINRINDRIKDGISRNLTDARLYYAIDKSYDVGFQQVPATLLESILDRDWDEKKVMSAFNEWGLGYLLTPAPCTCQQKPCSCGSGTKKVLNIPAFFKVFLPLVKAYVTIRWSKIYTDRNVSPLYKVEPFLSTAINRLRSEILTNRIQFMSTQLGYNTVMRQEIFQALLYSFALSFPKESWYTEKVEYVEEDGKTTEKIVREGIRYNTPHPSRVFTDQSDRPSTFNTDNGCMYAGYWNIVPWKSVKMSEDYWNKDAVTYGTNWISSAPSYFEEIFPCSMRFPSQSTPFKNIDGAITSHRPQQRDEALDSYYTTADDDKAVVLTEYFEKLNPKADGISDYDGFLWFRFVVASNDTIVFAEPLPYAPVIYTGYDADENRAKNASLALEVMPFQDHIGNLLSQYVLSVKQNLDKTIFYNTDVVDESHINQLKNIGEKRFRAPVYIPFSGKEQISFASTGPQNAFLPVNFPHQNTQEIAQSISAIINILERVLSLSAQELGQPATHEQTAQESIIIANNVSTRLGLTASFVDDASHARKVQLYNALMAYGNEEMYAQVSTDIPINASILNAIGFTVVPDNVPDEGTEVVSTEGEAIVVKGNKKGLIMDGFASNREGADRVNGPQLAGALANFMAAFANSSGVLLQLLGPEQTVHLFNQMATTAGFPRDFRLKVDPKVLQMQEQAAQQQGQGGQEMLQQVGEAIRTSQASTIEEVGKAIKPLRDALAALQTNDQKQNEAISQAIAQLNNLAGLAPQTPPVQ